MSISSGGRADKLGNRYEGLWVAYQLILLLAERVVAVQVEGIGEDERGVDVWVTRLGGTRDAQQCKRKNRSAGGWTVGDLDGRGVLKHSASQLDRNPAARFTLVSMDPAAELRELCDAARASGADAEAYFQSMLKVTAHAKHLRKYCAAVAASELDSAGRRRAFDLLCRTHTHLFEDSPEGKEWVHVHARTYIQGDPETAVTVLADFAQDRLGDVLSVDQVRRHLRERGLTPVNLIGNPQVAGRVEQLRREFRESLRPSLIHASLVPRPEAAAAFDLLTSSADRRLVVLHGRGGGGKSCVLLQLTDLLEGAGVPYLPLRLDRRPPRTSSRLYGIDGCGLPESPAVVLHLLHPGRRSVLVVDQLDAVRWTAAHASAPWEACRQMIDDALYLPDVAVVVACRTFDLRDDQQIHAWHSDRRGQELAVGDLPDEAVGAAVTSAGGDYAALTARQKSHLRSPLQLALWVQAYASDTTAPAWGTQADLMRAFWRSRFEASERMGVAPAESRAAVDAVVADMDGRGVLSASARVLDPYPGAAQALKSLNVVVEANRRITFAHQSYFEYQSAVCLLDRVKRDAGSVVEWVREGDQSLLRREQLRLALGLLRDEEPAEFVGTLRGLILSPEGTVRFHLRQLALRLLGESPAPTGPERDLLCELADDPRWRDHALQQVVTRQVAWAETLDDRGVLAGWLASPEDRLRDAALKVCRWWSGHCGDRVAGLVGPHLDRPEPWPQWAAGTLPYNAAEDSPALHTIRMALTRRGVVGHPHLMAKDLAERHPERLIDSIEARLEHRHDCPAASDAASESGLPYYVQPHDAEHLGKVAEAHAGLFWERIMPLVVRACEASRADPGGQTSPFFPDRTWPQGNRQFGRDASVELLHVVARAGAVAATADPEAFAARYATWLDHGGLSVQYTVGLALAGAGPAAADLAVSWLCGNPHRLSLLDERGRRWGVAQGIIRSHAAACSPADYDRLEATLLRYHDPEERRGFRWQLQCIRAGWRIQTNQYGLAQHALLPCLPDSRLGNAARSEMGVLVRKFVRAAAEYDLDHEVHISSLVGPMRTDRAARVSDEGWLEIMRGVAPTSSHRHRDIDRDTTADVTAEGYARLLGELSACQPGRFAQLALRIPDSVDPAYLAAVLHGVSGASPPNAESPDWVPATDSQVAAVVETVGYRKGRRIGDGMTRLMRQRYKALTSPAALEVLLRYATEHSNPSPKWVFSTSDPHHDGAAINSVRGTAVGAVARLLFAEPRLLGRLLPTIRRAVADPHPAVRVAALETCLAVLNPDRNLAVELFLSACSGPDEMLGSRYVWEFVRHALYSHHGVLCPLLLRMSVSAVPAVSSAGSVWLAVAALHRHCVWDTAAGLAEGAPAQRGGVAKAAAHNCGDSALVGRCAGLLDALLDDPDAQVREEAAKFLQVPGVLRTAEGRALATRFALSRGFAEHSSWLVEALRGNPDSLAPLAPIFEAVCGLVVAGLDAPGPIAEPRNRFAMDRFVPLILRLYEQAEQSGDRRLRSLCLDWWDELLRVGMGGTLQVMGDLEAAAIE